MKEIQKVVQKLSREQESAAGGGGDIDLHRLCTFRNPSAWLLVRAIPDSFPISSPSTPRVPGGCFTNVSRALQDILLNFVYCRIRTSYENFKLKLCTCAQSMTLGTRTKFQFEILTINVISSIVYFRDIILERSRNVSETTLWSTALSTCCPKCSPYVRDAIRNSNAFVFRRCVRSKDGQDVLTMSSRQCRQFAEGVT